jgi:hypothetical protein
VRRFIEAKRRKEIKQNYKKEVGQITVPDEIEECEELLTGERVILINN